MPHFCTKATNSCPRKKENEVILAEMTLPIGRAGAVIAVSACLLGLPTRYDGGGKRDEALLALLDGREIILLPVCPEAEAGLGIPREPMRLEGDPEQPRLVAIESRRDLTGPMEAWSKKRLAELAALGARAFILKARSPSCGKLAPVHASGEPRPGIFARQVMAWGKPVADEEELRDPELFRAFCDQITLRSQEK